MRLRWRAGAAIADQGLSVGTNFVITVVAARLLGVADFGIFGIAYLVYVMSIGVVRATVGEPALVRAGDVLTWRRDMVASGLAVALTSACLTATAGLVVGGAIRATLLTMAVLLPGMTAQDLGRYVAFAERRPTGALRLDASWATAQVLGLIGLWATGEDGIVPILLVWGGAGTLAAVVGLRQAGFRVPRPSVAWIEDSWEYSWRYLASFAATAGTMYVTSLLLGTITGVEAVGAVRAAQVVFGPLNVLYTAMAAVVVPQTIRVAFPDLLQGRLVKISALMAAAAGLVTVAFALAPNNWGTRVLGASWESTESLVLAAGAVAALAAVVGGATIGLQARRAPSEALSVQLKLVPLQLLLPIAGAIIGGASGYMWALAATQVPAGILTWNAFLRVNRRWQAAGGVRPVARQQPAPDGGPEPAGRAHPVRINGADGRTTAG